MNIILKAFFSLRFNFIRSGKVVTMDCVEKLIRKDMKDPFTGESLKESDIIPIKVSPFLAVVKQLINFWFYQYFHFPCLYCSQYNNTGESHKESDIIPPIN